MAKPVLDRFNGAFQADSATECWNWQRAKNRKGYGKLRWQGRQIEAHRFAYLFFNGPIAPGLIVHHVCHNPSCCNPKHLELVTPVEHTAVSIISRAAVNARKLFCKRGHEFTKANTYITSQGSRQCRACDALRDRRRRRWL